VERENDRYDDRMDNPCTHHFIGKIMPENLIPFARNPVICHFMMQLGRFDQLTSEVIPEVMNMLKMIKGEITRNEIMTILGLKDEKHFREHYMQTVINAHFMEMTIPDKPRSKNQKYRLTAIGQNLLKDSDDK
jgi:hypothetical protein